MKRDPFYREIWDGLGRDLDPEVFERCVCDLLRPDFPTLVPVRGGSDSGMDGAIADGEGPVFPVVCTTSSDVIGNLTKSLKSYINDGGTRRKVVSVTSQNLTPLKKQNLKRRAEVLGFALVQVYDRAPLADRLYDNPKWCLELLNLTGVARVLSTEPLSSRPLPSVQLIGREDDQRWLRETNGDRLLVGHPGSGKTSLLRGLVGEGGGWFLVGDDLAKVAPEIRSKRPDVVIVDDAHVDPDRLLKLVHLRREISAGFSIVASVWPGDQDRVIEVLGFSSSHIRELSLLTRDEIVQVIHSHGLMGSPALIREIVDQARGRPGLAVTLTSLCRDNGVHDVALGTALKRSVGSFLEKLVGRGATEILAAFAIGGDYGVSWRAVAREFGLSVIDVKRMIAGMEASGVVTDIGSEHIAVHPVTLRYALVRDVFFRDPARLDLNPLMEAAGDLRGVAKTLVGVQSVGGDVPSSFLQDVLEEVDSPLIWRDYAWLGRVEATYVLEEKPHLIDQVARPALHNAPDVVIDRLLETAVGNTSNLDSNTGHPLRLIRDWIQEARPGTEDTLKRRALLLRLASDWFSQGRDEFTGVTAVAIAFTPGYRGLESDPGAGRTVTLSFGHLLPHEILQVGELWSGWIGSSPILSYAGWAPLRGLLNDWVFPDIRIHREHPLREETRAALRRVAERMLRDVASLMVGRPGVQHLLAHYADVIGVPRPSIGDADYEVLFPGWRNVRTDPDRGEAKQRAAASRLAEDWVRKDPSWVAKRISELAEEAASADNRSPDHSLTVCGVIAERTDRPLAWIQAMTEAGASGGHVEPFLRAMVARNDPTWPAVAADLLERPRWRGMVMGLILTHPDPPADLLERVMGGLDSSHAESVETFILQRRVPEETVRRVLRHKEPALAFSAAIGEWLADPKGSVREALSVDWRVAILNWPSGSFDECWLREILTSDPELAGVWLETHLPTESDDIPRHDDVVSAATAVLRASDRLRLLARLPNDYLDGSLISRLVGDDLEVYRAFLADPRWRDRRLDPLTYPSSGPSYEDEAGLSTAWIEKARLAMAVGCKPEKVAQAKLGHPKGWSGPASQMWQSWVEVFHGLESHEDPLIREVGRIGSERAARSRDIAKDGERRFDVLGR